MFVASLARAAIDLLALLVRYIIKTPGIYLVLFLFDTSITSPLNLFICIKNKRIFIQSTRPSKSLIDSFRAHKTPQRNKNRKSIDPTATGGPGPCPCPCPGPGPTLVDAAFVDIVFWIVKKKRRPGSIIQIQITHVQSQQLCRFICFLYVSCALRQGEEGILNLDSFKDYKRY